MLILLQTCLINFGWVLIFFVVVVEPFVYFHVVFNVKISVRTLGSVVVIMNWASNDFKHIQQSKTYMLTKASFHSHLGKGQMIWRIIEVAVWRSLAEFQALAMRFTANVLSQETLIERQYIAVDRTSWPYDGLIFPFM